MRNASARNDAAAVDLRLKATATYAAGAFQIKLGPANGAEWKVYASSDLENWTLVFSRMDDGAGVVFETATENTERRFYQVSRTE